MFKRVAIAIILCFVMSSNVFADALSNYYLQLIYEELNGTAPLGRGEAVTDSMLLEWILDSLEVITVQDSTQISLYNTLFEIKDSLVSKLDSVISCNLILADKQDSSLGWLGSIDSTANDMEVTLNAIQASIDDSVIAKLNLIFRELEPSDTMAIFQYPSASLELNDSFTVILANTDSSVYYPSKFWGYDLVKYGTNDGPIRAILHFTSGHIDTLDIPFTGLSLGAQGSFLPSAVFYPMELDSIRIKCTEALDYLSIFWFAKHTQ
jgi:hypothetical protein